jgi:hypothetical protein
VLDLVNSKVEGKEVTTVAPEAHRRRSSTSWTRSSRAWPSERDRGQRRRRESEAAEAGASMAKKPPVKVAKRGAEQEKVEKKAQAGKK